MFSEIKANLSNQLQKLLFLILLGIHTILIVFVELGLYYSTSANVWVIVGIYFLCQVIATVTNTKIVKSVKVFVITTIGIYLIIVTSFVYLYISL